MTSTAVSAGMSAAGSPLLGLAVAVLCECFALKHELIICMQQTLFPLQIGGDLCLTKTPFIVADGSVAGAKSGMAWAACLLLLAFLGGKCSELVTALSSVH